MDHLVDIELLLVQDVVELPRLLQGSREPVEDRALLADWLPQVVLDEPDHDLVGNKPAFLHDGLDLLSHWSAALDLVSEHVASRKRAKAKLLLQLGTLGAFTGTRGTFKTQMSRGQKRRSNR